MIDSLISIGIVLYFIISYVIALLIIFTTDRKEDVTYGKLILLLLFPVSLGIVAAVFAIIVIIYIPVILYRKVEWLKKPLFKERDDGEYIFVDNYGIVQICTAEDSEGE